MQRVGCIALYLIISIPIVCKTIASRAMFNRAKKDYMAFGCQIPTNLWLISV